jgi:hypothetical protein
VTQSSESNDAVQQEDRRVRPKHVFALCSSVAAEVLGARDQEGDTPAFFSQNEWEL